MSLTNGFNSERLFDGWVRCVDKRCQRQHQRQPQGRRCYHQDMRKNQQTDMRRSASMRHRLARVEHAYITLLTVQAASAVNNKKSSLMRPHTHRNPTPVSPATTTTSPTRQPTNPPAAAGTPAAAAAATATAAAS